MEAPAILLDLQHVPLVYYHISRVALKHQQLVILSGSWENVASAVMRLPRRALPLSGARITQNLSVLRISLQTCDIDVQMVLLKMIEFLYFHKHHRTTEETIFKAEFFLLEI